MHVQEVCPYFSSTYSLTCILAAASVFKPTMLVDGVSTAKCAVEHLLLVSMEVMLISRFGMEHKSLHFEVFPLL